MNTEATKFSIKFLTTSSLKGLTHVGPCAFSHPYGCLSYILPIGVGYLYLVDQVFSIIIDPLAPLLLDVLHPLLFFFVGANDCMLDIDV